MMQTLAVNWQSIGMGLVIVLFLIVSTILILTVLIQKPQGGGLAGAFGSGAGSGQTAFGAKTGDALTWATIIMFVVWLVTSVGLNLAFRPADIETETEVGAPAGEPGATETTGGEVPGPTEIPVGLPEGAAPGTPAEGETAPPSSVTPAPEVPPATEPAPSEPSPTPETPETLAPAGGEE